MSRSPCWLALALALALLAACSAPRASEPERIRTRDPAAELRAWAERLQAQSDPVLRAAECARKLGVSGEGWSDCSARACESPSALIVQAQGECGADSCDGDAYLLNASGARATLPFGGHKACAADGSFALADVQLTPATEEAFYDPRQWQVVLFKFPSDGSASARFADCMSPALAPGGAEFVCRDRAGAVLRVGLGGGATRLVAEAGVPAERVQYDPQRYVYPQPPRFEGGSLRFSVDSDQGSTAHDVPWPPR